VPSEYLRGCTIPREDRVTGRDDTTGCCTGGEGADDPEEAELSLPEGSDALGADTEEDEGADDPVADGVATREALGGVGAGSAAEDPSAGGDRGEGARAWRCRRRAGGDAGPPSGEAALADA
jgi:hypothetical protein